MGKEFLFWFPIVLIFALLFGQLWSGISWFWIIGLSFVAVLQLVYVIMVNKAVSIVIALLAPSLREGQLRAIFTKQISDCKVQYVSAYYK